MNVYRKSSAETAMVKLNENPIMLSQVTDSLGNVGYPDPMFAEDRKLEENLVYTYQLAGVGFFNKETRLSDPVSARFAAHKAYRNAKMSINENSAGFSGFLKTMR